MGWRDGKQCYRFAAPRLDAAPRLIDGPDPAPATVLLAHGAGAPMDSPFMAAIAGGLAQRGWRVVRFEFPSMARQRSTGRRHGPDRMPVQQEAFRAQVRLERREHQEQRRTEHLAAQRSPTLILQGERDSFGRREEVQTYALSLQVQMVWIPAGDHSSRPTRSSGRSEAENLAAAVASSDRFLRQVVV